MTNNNFLSIENSSIFFFFFGNSRTVLLMHIEDETEWKHIEKLAREVSEKKGRRAQRERCPGVVSSHSRID